MHTKFLKFATHKPTGKIIHIDSVNSERSKRRECVCEKCEEQLEAVLDFQEEKRKPFFRHQTSNCDGSQETALHKLGKQIILENNKIALPKYGIISYTDAIAEKTIESKRPDIVAKSEGLDIYFEIYVTSKVQKSKDVQIKNEKINCLEIDLSGHRDSELTIIEQSIIKSIKNKRLIYWASVKEREQQQKQKEQIDAFINMLSRNWKKILGFIAAAGLTYLAFKPKKKKNNKSYS